MKKNHKSSHLILLFTYLYYIVDVHIMIYEKYHITNMLSSGLKFLFVIIFLEIYICNAMYVRNKNLAVQPKHQTSSSNKTCKCGKEERGYFFTKRMRYLK